MATTATLFDHTSEILTKYAFTPPTLNLALVDSGYTLDTTHTVWTDISISEISGTGYTSGGQTLAGVTLTRTGGVTTLDATDLTWSTLTATFRGGVLYVSGAFAGLTDPVLAYYLWDNTPADVVVSAADYPVVWSVDGLLTVS